MTDAPTGAPAPQPDLERHPRTRITRLPYIVLVLLALIAVSIWGVVTRGARNTSDREVIGFQATPPPPAAQPPTQSPPR